MDEITAKFNRDVEIIQSDHEGMWQQISIHSNQMKEAAKDTEEMVERRLKENVDEIEKRMAILLTTEFNVEMDEVRKEGEGTSCLLYTSRCV